MIIGKAQVRRPRRFVWRSFLLLVLLLHPTISFSFHTSPQSHLNITPHYPFNLATPILLLPLSTSSPLSLCHVNKWWPSWHDCKFVSSEIKNSQRERERERETEGERNHAPPLCRRAHLGECARRGRHWCTCTTCTATRLYTGSCSHWIPAEPSQVTAL